MNGLLLNSFEEYLRAERSASDSTVESYKRDVRGFVEFISLRSEKSLNTAESQDIREYIGELNSRGKAAATVSRCISSIKCFYSWLLQSGVIASDPAHGIEKQKVTKSTPDILSYSDIRKILAVPSGRDAKSLRDKAMLETLYATGMRASEIIHLDVTDVDIIGKSIRCASGEKLRLIPIHSAASAAIDEYLRLSRPGLAEPDGSKALFVNLSGERLTRQGFWKIMKYCQEKAGIDKNISPKTLRHSFAVNLMENGADMYSVKEMLGHKDIVSTRKYNELVNRRVKEVYYTTHPRV